MASHDTSRHDAYIVPMPWYSSYIGCARLGISVLIIAFISACIQILGTNIALVWSLSSSLATLCILGYYAASIGYFQWLYRIRVILAMELFGTLLWAVSTILLAIWTHTFLTTDWLSEDTIGVQNYLKTLPKGLMPVKIATQHFKKYATGRYVAATRLAGISAGLSGLACVLFIVTATLFAKSIRNSMSRTAANPMSNSAAARAARGSIEAEKGHILGCSPSAAPSATHISQLSGRKAFKNVEVDDVPAKAETSDDTTKTLHLSSENIGHSACSGIVIDTNDLKTRL